MQLHGAPQVASRPASCAGTRICDHYICDHMVLENSASSARLYAISKFPQTAVLSRPPGQAEIADRSSGIGPVHVVTIIV